MYQAWKDLHRDVITVNGEVISGAVGGPEDMIGTLVRKILEHVQCMREKYVSSVGPPVATSSTEYIGKMRKRQATYADLDEGQALSCARDVLLSCNRTQSGGDTYYTIESLLVNKEFAVLTPFACEADPLEIIVDIVESEKRRALANIEEHDDGLSEEHSLPEGRHEPASMDRFDVVPRSSEHSRNTDDTTESSVYTPSSDEFEHADHIPRGYNQPPHATSYFPGRLHYDSTELPSDIPGATALPSSVLLSREHSRRGKKGGGVMSASSSVASGGSSDASYGTEAEASLSNPDDG